MWSWGAAFLRTEQGEREAESRKERLLEARKEKELLLEEGCSGKSCPDLRTRRYQPCRPCWSSPPGPSSGIPPPQGQAPPMSHPGREQQQTSHL